MTRWARAGNSQKHKKMPEDPTSWEELSKGIKNSTKCKEKQKSPKSDKPSETVRNDKSFSKKKQTLKDKSAIFHTAEEHSSEVIINNEDCKTGKEMLKRQLNNDKNEDCKTGKEMSKRQLKKMRREEKKLKTARYSESECISDSNNIWENVPVENSDVNESKIIATDKALNTSALSKKHLKRLEKDETNPEKPNISSPNKLEETNLDSNKKKASLTPEAKKLKKKELFMKKLQERRAQNGITLLSPAAENRLYRIKKRLRQKGYTPDMIKDIIRKERRKAELEFRKTTFTKTCFNCGQPGHLRADCHISPNKTNPDSHTCLKCGSTEHNSIECNKKDFEVSSLTCFTCKGQGHMSKDCPSKKRGAAKEEEKPVVALHTISEGRSIDDEIIDSRKTAQKPKLKKPRVVVF